MFLHLEWQSTWFFAGLFGCLTCKSLAPGLGIEARPLAMKAQSPNHWTAREFPAVYLELIFIYGVR